MWFLLSIYFLLSFRPILGINMQDERFGRSFIDTFSSEKKDIWVVEEKLRCIFHECVYLSKENVDITSRKVIEGRDYFGFNKLYIHFRNDCNGPHCCKDNLCTHYSSGNVLSKDIYGYGSFRFHALPTHMLFSTERKLFSIYEEILPSEQKRIKSQLSLLLNFSGSEFI